MNAATTLEGSGLDPDERARAACPERSLRWAVVRLVAVWTPIAAVLALVLWNALFLTLAPWDHRGSGAPAFDALPSQLLVALLFLAVGAVETAPRNGARLSTRAVRAYWALSALLVGAGAVALWFMAMNRPVLQ